MQEVERSRPSCSVYSGVGVTYSDKKTPLKDGMPQLLHTNTPYLQYVYLLADFNLLHSSTN